MTRRRSRSSHRLGLTDKVAEKVLHGTRSRLQALNRMTLKNTYRGRGSGSDSDRQLGGPCVTCRPTTSRHSDGERCSAVVWTPPASTRSSKRIAGRQAKARTRHARPQSARYAVTSPVMTVNMACRRE